MCPVCRMLQHPANRTHNPQLMDIVVPETCCASNKICNKTSVASSWHFISTYILSVLLMYKQTFCDHMESLGHSL